MISSLKKRRYSKYVVDLVLVDILNFSLRLEFYAFDHVKRMRNMTTSILIQFPPYVFSCRQSIGKGPDCIYNLTLDDLCTLIAD